jgi:hypothetical protein
MLYRMILLRAFLLFGNSSYIIAALINKFRFPLLSAIKKNCLWQPYEHWMGKTILSQKDCLYLFKTFNSRHPVFDLVVRNKYKKEEE